MIKVCSWHKPRQAWFNGKEWKTTDIPEGIRSHTIFPDCAKKEMAEAIRQNIYFYGWHICKINGVWYTKPTNCDYPVQTFTYVIDALIFAKENPIVNAKMDVAKHVIAQMNLAREIRRVRKSC